MTSNLIKRVYEHKQGVVAGFTKKYNVKTLVYFEETGSVESAIIREKRIKKWLRQWKVNLIEKQNPQWVDLYDLLVTGRELPADFYCVDSRLRGNDNTSLE